MRVYNDKNVVKVEFAFPDPINKKFALWTLTLVGAQSDELYARFIVDAVRKALKKDGINAN